MALVSSSNMSDLQPVLGTVFEVKHKSMRAVVGVSCSLSILGSLLIIFSYVLFKKRRTRAREILLHISLMDLGVALSNLIGLSVYFDQYYWQHEDNMTEYRYIEYLCKTQAFFSAYTTYSSILWTISLAGFLYFLIIHHKNAKISVYFQRASYIVCYGLPLVVSLWLVCSNKLGYSPRDSSGWCSLIGRDPVTEKVELFTEIFGNDLWIYLAMVTIPILYLSIRCHLMNKVREVKNYVSEEKFWSSLHHVDYKFLLIPVVFVFLRIWSVIVTILFIYMNLPPDGGQIPTPMIRALLYLSGIGDSSQGSANAILFVIFTKNIREGFVQCCTCRKKKGGGVYEDIEKEANSDPSNLNTISSDRNRHILEESTTSMMKDKQSSDSGLFDGLSAKEKTHLESGLIIQNYGGVAS